MSRGYRTFAFGLLATFFGFPTAAILRALVADDRLSWASVVLIGVVGGAVTMMWQAFRRFWSTPTRDGIRAPTLWGWRVTPWADVQRIYRRGRLLHVDARGASFVLDPWVFRDPAHLDRFLAEHIPPGVPRMPPDAAALKIAGGP